MNYVITWAEALQAFFGVISFLAGSLLTGSFLIKKYIQGKYTPLKLFMAFVSGMIMLVSIYAIWKTQGRTILLPVPFLLPVGLFFIKRDDSLNVPQEEKYFSWQKYTALIFSLSVLYFLFFLQIYLSGTENSFSHPGVDDIFYSRVIDYLNIYGIENSHGDFFFPNDIGVNPYHYFDLWVAALISKIFGITSVNALVLCSFTIYCVLTSIGILALLNILFQKELKTWTLLLISALSGLFSGSKIFFPSSLLKSDIFNIPIANYPKVALVAIFLILLLILAKKSLWNSFLIFATILALSFINVLPAIVGSCIICILLFIFILKEKSIIQILPGFLTLIIGLCYIPAFYAFWEVRDNPDIVIQSSYHGIASYKLSVKSLKTTINIFVGGALQLFLILPFIIIGFSIFISKYQLNFNKIRNLVSFNNFLLILFIFPLSGLVSWAILYQVSSDSVQFYHNIIIPFFGIFITLIIAFCFVHGKYYKILAYVSLVIMVASNLKYDNHKVTFDKEEWALLNSFIKPSNGLLVNFRGNTDFQTSVALSPLASQPLDVLYYKFPQYNNTCLSNFKVNFNKDNIYTLQNIKVREETPLFRYSRLLLNGTQKNEENIQMTFLDKFKIKYISMSKYAKLPDNIKLRVNDSINLPSSGWRIYQLKYKN